MSKMKFNEWEATTNSTLFLTGTLSASVDIYCGGSAEIAGDLTVKGTTITVDATNLVIEDPLLVLAKNVTGAPSYDAGFVVERGTSTNVAFIYDESADEFTVINTTEAGTTAGNVSFSSYADFRAGTLFTDNGSGLVLTDSDVAHGTTNVAQTDAYGALGPIHGTYGGLMINGLSDQESADARSLALRGISNDTHTDTVPLVEIIGAKRSGTTVQALAAAETVLQVANHTTTLMTVLGDGKVGVGTTTPSYALDVTGDGRFTGNLIVTGTLDAHVEDFKVTANTMTFGDASGDTVTFNASTVSIPNNLNFDSNTFVLDASNNRVGVGTASPGSTLDVRDGHVTLTDADVATGITGVAATEAYGDIGPIHTTRGGLMINGLSDQESADARSLALRGISNDTHTDTVPLVEIIGAKRSGTTVQALADAETVLQVANHTTTLMTVLGDGKVGIGTTTPAYTLTVSGSMYVETAATFNSNVRVVGLLSVGGAVDSESSLRIADLTNSKFVKYEGAAAGDRVTSKYIGKLTDGSSTERTAIIENIPGATAAASRFRLGYADTDLNIVDGNIGIGTTSPVSRLDVEGGVSIGASYAGTTAAPTNGLLVETYVGVGQSSPASDNASTHFVHIGNSSATSAGLILHDGEHKWEIQNNGWLVIRSGAESLAYWKNTGNKELVLNTRMGIGVDDPDSLLEVFGTSNQLKLSYDATNYSTFAVGATGGLTITTVDPDAADADLTLTLDGAFDVNANQEVAIDSTVASITIGAALADGQTLKLGKNGAVETIIAPHGTAGSELYSVTNTAGTAVGPTAAAIQLSATAGGIGIRSAANLEGCIQIEADGGVDETISIHSDQGTGHGTSAASNASINLISDSGGIALSSGRNGASAVLIEENGGTDGRINIHADTGLGRNSAGNGDTASISIYSDGGGIGLYSGNDDDNAIRIETDGGVGETIVLNSNQGTGEGTSNASIQLLSDVGGIDLTATGLTGVMTDGNSDAAVQLSALAGGIGIRTTSDLAGAIQIEADGGTSETIIIKADQGTSTSSINLVSDAGGIALDAAKLIKLDGAGVEIENDSATGASALLIDNDDVDQNALEIVAENTTVDVISITANSLTTGNVIGMTTTAKIPITLDLNYSDTSAVTVAGLDIDIDKTGTSTTDNTIYGVHCVVDNTTATNGTNTVYGLFSAATLTHAADAGTASVYGAKVSAVAGTNGAGKAVGLDVRTTGGDANYPLLALGGYSGFGTSAPTRILSVYGNVASGPVLAVTNDGDNANRNGIGIQAGADDGSGTTAYIIAADGSGDVVGYLENASETFAVRDASDARIKDNIRDTSINGLEIINDIKVRDFELKKSGNSKTGLVAQELQEVYPAAVSGEEDRVDDEGNMMPMTVAYSILVPALVKSIQELSAKVAELEQKLAD